MTVWVGLAVGLVLGWIAEWIVDWLYWRRNIEGFYATEAELQGEVAQLLSEADTLRREANEHRSNAETLRSQLDEQKSGAEGQHSDISRLEQQTQSQDEELRALRVEIATLTSALEEAHAQKEAAAAEHRDDLEQIDGIGPVFEQRLFDAGIETYADIISSSPARLEEIIQPQGWQAIDFESWIEQAREFAKVKVIDLLPTRLEEISGIGPTYARKLNAAGITSFRLLAACDARKLHDIIEPKAWQKVDFGGWLKQARAFDLLIAGNRPPHPLEEINGIGAVNAIRLELAGISSIADLAKVQLDDLNNIIGAKGGRTARLQDWIEQAKEMTGEVVQVAAEGDGDAAVEHDEETEGDSAAAENVEEENVELEDAEGERVEDENA